MKNSTDRSQNGRTTDDVRNQSTPRVSLHGRWGAAAGKPRLVTFSWGAVAPSQWMR